METSVLKNRLLEKFIMQEFVNGNLGTKEAVDNMMNLISHKLNISLAESADFIRKAIGIQYMLNYKNQEQWNKRPTINHA